MSALLATLVALTCAGAAWADDTASSTVARPLDVPAKVDELVASRKPEFERSVYEFCNDEDFNTFYRGKRFCALVDKSSYALCPALEKICTTKQEQPWWFSIPGLPPWVGYVLIGVIVALLLFVFIRAVQKGGWVRDLEFDFGEADGPIDFENLRSLPDAPALAIFNRARTAFDAGNTAEALLILQVALLRYCDDNGLARFHPSRTNGDYLRVLRKHPTMRELYRRVAFGTDRHRFGDGHVDRGEVQSLLADAQKEIKPRSTPSTAGATVAVLLLALCNTACDEDRAYHDYGPSGLAALPAVLERAGIETKIDRMKFEDVPDDVGVVVLRTGATSRFGVIDASLSIDPLLDRDLAVVVIDDAGGAAHFLPVTETSTTITTTSAEGVVDVPRYLTQTSDPFCSWWPKHDALSPRVLTGARLEVSGDRAPASQHPLVLSPLLTGPPDKHLVVGATRQDYDGVDLVGCLIVFGDKEPLTNASLTLERNATWVSRLFASLLREGETVLFLDTLDERKRPESIARSIGDAKMVPIVLQSGLLLVLLLIAVGSSFGPMRDPKIVEHKAFIEHVEALGRHYHAAGAPGLRHSAHALARLVVLRHRHQVRGGQGARWTAIARHLAEKHDLPESDVRSALRLGIEGISDLGTTGLDDLPAESTRMLKTLTTLLAQHESNEGR